MEITYILKQLFMQILNYNGGEFCVAHFQGNCQSLFPQVTDIIYKQHINLPEDVEIVTVTTHPEMSVLVEQLDRFNIDYINKVPYACYWTNLKKIGYIIEGLNEIKSKYALVLDASDVLLTRDIVNIVNKFNLLKKKLIFGASKNNYPDLLIDKIYDRDFRGDFRYLNAGTCFGTVDACLEFYTKANDILKNILIYNPQKSEQLIIRETFKSTTDYVDFDYQCILFQTFSRSYVRKVNDGSYMVI